PGLVEYRMICQMNRVDPAVVGDEERETPFGIGDTLVHDRVVHDVEEAICPMYDILPMAIDIRYRQRAVGAQRGETPLSEREHETTAGNLYRGQQLTLLQVDHTDGWSGLEAVVISIVRIRAQSKCMRLRIRDEAAGQRDLALVAQIGPTIDRKHVLAFAAVAQAPVGFRDIQSLVVRRPREIGVLRGKHGPDELRSVAIEYPNARMSDGIHGAVDELVGHQAPERSDSGG